jgi:hypothetical protein
MPTLFPETSSSYSCRGLTKPSFSTFAIYVPAKDPNFDSDSKHPQGASKIRKI